MAHPDEQVVAKLPRPALVPRPDIQFQVSMDPDFHEELRWPLTAMNHPVLEPKFPIAQELADPGIDWMELCGRGIQNRYGRDKELLTYLRGWCKAIDGDVDAACSNLAPLIRTTTPRLEVAVRNDLANILAQAHADKAEHFIRVYAIRDVRMLDLLAANYVEVGTNDDAITINRAAMDSDDYATAATKCIRWTKQIVLSDDRKSLLIKQIESLANAPKNPDQTCVREYHKLRCWAGTDCEMFMRDQGATFSTTTLFLAYRLWPNARTAHGWWTVADGAILANPEPGYAELAVAAMENAIRLEIAEDGTCGDSSATSLKHYWQVVQPGANSSLLPRFKVMFEQCGVPYTTANAP